MEKIQCSSTPALHYSRIYKIMRKFSLTMPTGPIYFGHQ